MRMFAPKNPRIGDVILVVALAVLGGRSTVVHAQGTKADYARADGLRERTRGKVPKLCVEPTWLEGGTRFWYRNELAAGAREFILVDAVEGTRRPAFDHAKLADAMTRVTGALQRSTHLPFERIAFPTPGILAFETAGKTWRYDIEADRLEAGDPIELLARPSRPSQAERNRPSGRRRGPRAARGQESPDGNWAVERAGHDLRLRDKRTGEDHALTEGGTEAESYDPNVFWSPDSKKLVAMRRAVGDKRTVHLIESSPTDQVQPKLHSFDYLKPGDRPTVAKPHLFDVGTRTEVAIKDELFKNPWSLDEFRWSSDSTRFRFLDNERGHQVLRWVSINASTGESQAIINETSQTFIDYSQKLFLEPLEATEELLWMSERDGWNHLYLIDERSGQVKNQVTKGEWVVRGVDRVDEVARQVWFRAGGIRPGQDPYFIHHARVNFDGTGLILLTEGDGTHQVEFSPDRRWLIDTWSRVDHPPVSELRSVEDGKLVRELERADWSALLESGWRSPERFAAKGRDGQTEIYGVIFRPSNFDPRQSYPVIEQIYAGPHGAFVPKAFTAWSRTQSLAELGFIVVQVDGMGTNWRSKAFHDVCWRNLGDAGFPDRILWMQAAARKDPALDLSRVGIYGGSAGGQNAMGSLLFHPEFYKVGVADCGCHDNRMDKIWWNEAWMGWPVGPHYAEQSNVTNAHKLVGKLLLFVGELDRNVDPASTMQVVNALIKAGKDFDFVVFPGAGHGAGGGPYGERRMRDFFVRHLLHVEPPDRNDPEPAPAQTGELALEPAAPKPTEVSDQRPLNPSPAPAVIAAPAPAAAPTPVAAPAPASLGIRECIERYAADRNALQRSFPAASSSAQTERMRRLCDEWLGSLASFDFASLDQVGRVDYLLLKNEVVHQKHQLDREQKDAEAIASYVPFARTITDLEEARRRMEWIEPAQGADRLNQLVRQINETSKAIEARLAAESKIEAGTAGSAPGRQSAQVLANRAARVVQELRTTLKEWNSFRDGYDPAFMWWMTEPYKAVDKALEDYASLLREKGAGLKRGDELTIIGDPIGREALMAELAYAMIPYTPEELVAIAESEFAWCETEMQKTARDMGFGEDWKKAFERVKSQYVEPGQQPTLVRDLALEAIRFVEEHDLVTVPPLARETCRIEMMSPQRQLVTPYLAAGEFVNVSFPTNTMTHEQKLMSMRGNNKHFTRATVPHEVIPGHHLQGYMSDRYRPYRKLFRTAFLVEGWPLYWETLLWDLQYAKSPEDRVGMLFWRMHRSARIIFSLGFHLGTMSPRACVDLLVNRVGHEVDNATAEVRRSVSGDYDPLYQCAYMLGGLQIRALRRELVDSRILSDRAFHDAILRENAIPIEMIRASLVGHDLTRDFKPSWRFAERLKKE